METLSVRCGESPGTKKELETLRKGKKVVLCGGVFDIIHPGHAFVLEKAKEHGDLLVVIIARDSTVESRKRIPIVPESQRLEMIKHIKPVDIAMFGKEGGFLEIIEEIRPDVIALGPNQSHDAGEIGEKLKKMGIPTKIVRIEKFKECPLHSTKDILLKIIERGYPR